LDSRLIYQYNEWFVSVPHKIKTHVAENQGRVVALDPGVWTFQTFYSEQAAGQIGYNDLGRIQRLCFYLDDLISRTSKATDVSSTLLINRLSKYFINPYVIKKYYESNSCVIYNEYYTIKKLWHNFLYYLLHIKFPST
jgi:hypothetical protein